MALRDIETNPVKLQQHLEVQRSIAGTRMAKLAHRTEAEKAAANSRFKNRNKPVEESNG